MKAAAVKPVQASAGGLYAQGQALGPRAGVAHPVKGADAEKVGLPALPGEGCGGAGGGAEQRRPALAEDAANLPGS